MARAVLSMPLFCKKEACHIRFWQDLGAKASQDGVFALVQVGLKGGESWCNLCLRCKLVIRMH